MENKYFKLALEVLDNLLEDASLSLIMDEGGVISTDASAEQLSALQKVADYLREQITIYWVRLETLNEEGEPIESTDLLDTDDYLYAVAFAKKFFKENKLEHNQQVIVQDEDEPEGVLCGFSK